jgi:hypothetical protein
VEYIPHVAFKDQKNYGFACENEDFIYGIAFAYLKVLLTFI